MDNNASKYFIFFLFSVLLSPLTSIAGNPTDIHQWDNDTPAFHEIKHKRPRANNRWDSYENYRKAKKTLKPASKLTAQKKYKKPVHRNSKRTAEHKNYRLYKVKNGDTLYKISRKFKISVKQLCTLNKIHNKNRIPKNSYLKIPAKNYKKPAKKTKSMSVAHNKKKKHKKSPSPHFMWPVTRIKSYKKDGSNDVKSIGIVITGKNGSSVVSSESGTVKKVSHMRGYGNYVIIEHKNRYMTIYSRLGNVYVKTGQKIKKGTRIGQLSNHNRLHFQIGHAGKPQNPLKFLPNSG